jgi:hypothetical protein
MHNKKILNVTSPKRSQRFFVHLSFNPALAGNLMEVLMFLAKLFQRDSSSIESVVVDQGKIDLVNKIQDQFRVYAEKENLTKVELILHSPVADDLMDLATDIQMPPEKIVEVLITSFLGYTVDERQRLINVSPLSNLHMHLKKESTHEKAQNDADA